MRTDIPIDDFELIGPKQSGGQRVPDDGWHLWIVCVESAEYQNVGYEKPYLDVRSIVVSADYTGLPVPFRVYLHPKAHGWARYFAGKFSHDKELLAAGTFRKSEVVGKEGMLLVLVSSETGQTEFDIRGFGRAEGDPELERRYFRMRGQQPQAEESVDVYEDLRGAQAEEDDDPWPTE